MKPLVYVSSTLAVQVVLVTVFESSVICIGGKTRSFLSPQETSNSNHPYVGTSLARTSWPWWPRDPCSSSSHSCSNTATASYHSQWGPGEGSKGQSPSQSLLTCLPSDQNQDCCRHWERRMRMWLKSVSESPRGPPRGMYWSSGT